MYDLPPPTLEEIVDQCRALTYAVIELPNPEVKELLIFVLCERLELLNQTLEMPIEEEDRWDCGHSSGSSTPETGEGPLRANEAGSGKRSHNR